MKFTLEVELGNAAMQTLEDVSSAIHGIGLDGETVAARVGEGGRIRDLNGNTVGKWEVTA